jgi:hypothetical protein
VLAWLLASGFVALALATLRWLAPLHPLQLWALPWAGASTLYACRLLPYKPLSATTLAIVAGGTAAFAAATLLAGGRAAPAGRATIEGSWIARTVPRAALVMLVVAGLWLLAFLADVTLRFGLRAALVSTPEVRIAIGDGGFALTIKYIYAALAAALLCGLAAALAETSRDVRRWLALGVAASLSAYFTTGRSTAVVALLMGAIGFGLLRPEIATGRRLVAAAAGVAVIAVAALFAGGAIIGKTYANSELPTIQSQFTDHEALESLALPYQYATAPIASLNELVAATGTWGHGDPCATVTIVCTAAAAVGAPLEPEPVIRPFTQPPLPWNTYTAFDAPLIDGGIALAIPIAGLLGLMVGLSWRLAARSSIYGILSYPILATAVLFSIVQNNFFAFHFVGALLLSAAAMLTIHKLDGRVSA